MRGKGLWLSIKSIFAPTEVAGSPALLVLVIWFARGFLGARRPDPRADSDRQSLALAVLAWTEEVVRGAYQGVGVGRRGRRGRWLCRHEGHESGDDQAAGAGTRGG